MGQMGLENGSKQTDRLLSEYRCGEKLMSTHVNALSLDLTIDHGPSGQYQDLTRVDSLIQ